MKLTALIPVISFTAVLAVPSAVAATTPSTTSPETTVPQTTVPETTLPGTTVPETTVPETTVPEERVVSVESIDITVEASRATATVEVVDADGNPVDGARVVGYWSDGAFGRSRATSDADGIATTRARPVWTGWRHHRFHRPTPPSNEPRQPTFTVNRVKLPEGYTWDGVEVSGTAALLNVSAAVVVKVNNGRARAEVTVVDSNGTPVPRAIVIGRWSNGSTRRSWKSTNRNGVARTPRVRTTTASPEFKIERLILPAGYQWQDAP